MGKIIDGPEPKEDAISVVVEILGDIIDIIKGKRPKHKDKREEKKS